MRYKIEKKIGTSDDRVDGIVQLDDSGNWLCWIPSDSANSDWQEYQAWLAADPENNVPEPADEE